MKTVRIAEREFLDTIPGSVAFGVQRAFSLNPGLVASFPWLSIEAAGWESYKFNKLRFTYYTRKGSSTDGSVMMAPDYDPMDPAPPSEAVMLTYQDSVEFAPWMDAVCCDLDESQLNKIGKHKFIRAGKLPTNANLADFDSGVLYIATSGMADTSNVGKLWVEYDVTFQTKATNVSSVAPTNAKSSWYGVTAGAQTVLTSIATTILAPTDIIDGVGAVNTAGSFVLPAGNYNVNANFNCYDTVNEILAGNVDLQKNGVSVMAGSAMIPYAKQAGTASGVGFCLPLDAVIASNGSDIYTFVATLTGAAGVITVAPSIIFTAI